MPSQAAKRKAFADTLPPEDSELIICPPDCRVDHDAKYPDWLRNLPKQEEKPVRHPAGFAMDVAPTHQIARWEDPYPSLDMKDWKRAIARDGKSPWVQDATDYGDVAVVDLPDQKSLMRHAMLFGSQEVEDTARLYGVELPSQIKAIPSKSLLKKKAKKSGPKMSRRDQAKQLLELGHTWTTIEDTLDLPKSVSDNLRKELIP